MLRTLTCAFFMIAVSANAQSVRFGDNSSEWANDGECDDRRFVGANMASELDNDDILHDANDCQSAYERGLIVLLDATAAKAATVCSNIKFGTDDSRWSNDGECDDYRFDGRSMASVISVDDAGRDATDCKRLCDAGVIYLRDY